MTLLEFKDFARELIARAGYQVDAERAHVGTSLDGSCFAAEFSTEVWGSDTYYDPSVSCTYHKTPFRTEIRIVIKGEEA